jgi:hypothetical protein
VGVQVLGEAGLDGLAVAQEPAVARGVAGVTHHVGVAAVVVARPTRPPEHLEDVERAHVHLALQRIVELRVADHHTPGGEVHAPGQRRRREQQFDVAAAEPRLDAVFVLLREPGVVEADAVEHRLPQGPVRQVLAFGVEVVVPSGADGDVPAREFVAGLLGGADGVLAGGDEHQRLPALADVGLGQIQRAVEPAVLVGEGVVAVGVRAHLRLQRYRPVGLVESERTRLGSVQPGRHVVDVLHGRRQRDHPRRAEAAQPRDRDLQDGAAAVAVEQVDLVDDTEVDVADEAVARGVVLAGGRIGLLGGHHEDVGALGAPGTQVALAGDDVDRVAQFLEAGPLAFLLVGERSQRREKERGAPAFEDATDRRLRDGGLPAGGRRAHDGVLLVR